MKKQIISIQTLCFAAFLLLITLSFTFISTEEPGTTSVAGPYMAWPYPCYKNDQIVGFAHNCISGPGGKCTPIDCSVHPDD